MPFLWFHFQNFLNSSSCPEIQGYLHLKEPGRKSWKKLYMFLRRSGLYYSTKGTSKVLLYCSRERETLLRAKYLIAKLISAALFMVISAVSCEMYQIPPPVCEQEPRHLQLLSDLDDSNVFTVITGRKLHNAPTDFQFCIKVT